MNINLERVGEIPTPYCVEYNTGQVLRRVKGKPVYLWAVARFERAEDALGFRAQQKF